MAMYGSIAQLGEHLPYKQRVTGSRPVVPTKRHRQRMCASVAQLVEQRTENPRVVGSIPTGGTICGCSSSGRAPPCQGGGSEFEPRHPLQTVLKGERFFFCIFSENKKQS